MATLSTVISYGEPTGTIVTEIGTPGPTGQTGPQGPAGPTFTGGPITSPITYDAGTNSTAFENGDVFAQDNTSGSYGAIYTGGLQASNGDLTIDITGAGITFGDSTFQSTAFPGSGAFYPSTGNPSGFLTAASLSGYATQSWVTSQGYATQSYVNGQGFITASALTPYLLSSTAASTYQTLSGMSSYLTKAGNLSGLANTATARTNLGLGTMATQTASNYLTVSAAAAGYYPLSGNPSGFITSSALTGYATESFVTSQGYIGDAPSDGSQYARQDGAWEIVTGGGGGSYLPLAGGTMTGPIVFDGTSGQYISKGNFDTSRGGNYGISLVCSIGYEFNWQAGWLTTTNQGSVTPRPLYLDSLAGTTLRAWDSETDTGTEVAHTGINVANASPYYVNVAPDILKVFESTNELGVTIAHDSIAIQHIDTPNVTGYVTNEYIGFEDLGGSPHSAFVEHDVITVQDETNTTQMRSTGISLSAGGSITFGDSTIQTTAGLTDAPSDDQTYGRNNGAWVVAGGGGGGAAWGSITGTLSSQTDLQTALDAKVGEAPQDNVVYGRVDGVWVPIPGTPTYTLIATGYTSIAGWLFSGTNIYLGSNGKVITDTPGSANGEAGGSYFRINGSDTPGATLDLSSFTGITMPIQLYSISSSNAPVLPSSLAISGVEINGYAPADLPAAIFGYGGISYLNITNADITSVPSLSGISSLQGFYIDSCGSIASLPNFNSSVSGLTSFTAQYNASLTSIPELTSMSSLNYININGNPALTTIPQFANLPALANLYITNNTGLISPPTFGTSTMFGGELVLSISGNTSMIGAPTLEYGKVVIIDNNTAMTGTPVFYNGSMSILQLNGNTSMTAGPDLSGINLTSASMSGNSSMVTPPSFYNCTLLTSLSVNYNVSMTAIPVTTGCSSLSSIDFSYNTAMTGTSDFTGRSSLSVLVMNDCAISVAPDFYGTYGIYSINLNNNAITSGLTGLLDQIDSFGTVSGYIGISGGTNEAIDPTYSSLTSLQAKGWTIVFNSL